MQKWAGASFGNLAFNVTAGLSSSNFTETVKFQTDMPLVGVRFLVVNRAANALAGFKMLCAPTETADTSTGANLGQPIIGGATYAALKGATNALGWSVVTFNDGVATLDPPAGNTYQSMEVSDQIAYTSVPRADGGAGYLNLMRAYVNGAVTNFAFIISNALLRTPTAAMRNRIQQVGQSISDAVGTPATSPALTTTQLEVYPILYSATQMFSFWDCGDSLVQNDGLVTDGLSSGGLRAALSLSTEARPVIYANWGASSQSGATFFSLIEQALLVGCPAPDLLVIEPASVNDYATPNTNLFEIQKLRLDRAIQICHDNGIPNLAIRLLLPNEGYSLSDDNLRKGQNAAMAALAAKRNIPVIDLSGLGDGASPEKWVPAYKFDAKHFNETGVEDKVVPAYVAVIRPML